MLEFSILGHPKLLISELQTKQDTISFASLSSKTSINPGRVPISPKRTSYKSGGTVVFSGTHSCAFQGSYLAQIFCVIHLSWVTSITYHDCKRTEYNDIHYQQNESQPFRNNIHVMSATKMRYCSCVTEAKREMRHNKKLTDLMLILRLCSGLFS